MSEQKTFVHKDTEVKLTGRTAEKVLKATRKGSVDRIAILYEITPVDALNGSWKRWVQMPELFEIK